MDRTIARNQLQNHLNLPRPLADWFASAATAEELESISGSSVPADAVIRGVAVSVLDRLRLAIAPAA